MNNKIETKFKVGNKVVWKWLGREIHGVVMEVFDIPIVKNIKGKSIKRNGTKGNPAHYVRSEAGNYALKLGTELKKIEKTMKLPKMFS